MITLKKKIIGCISPQQRYINSLELKIDTLETAIKDELFKLFMEKLGEPAEMARLKKENKKLRQEKKALKAIVVEGHRKHGKKSKM